MKILAFDTSSIACSVALLIGDNITTLHKIKPMQQAHLILPMIEALLQSQNIQLDQLDAIAYGCGPGSFTGIRIASSVAQGIGFATRLPIIPVSSLAALAQSAFLEKQWSPLFVAVDARMDQLYWAVYQANQNGYVELIHEERLCTGDKIETYGLKGYGVGDGWQKYENILIQQSNLTPQSIDSQQLPTASAIAQLAKIKLKQGEFVTPEEAVPVYLQ